MSNVYESGSRKIIPAVLLYAFSDDRVLMIHRDQKKNDFHEGKWNGLGGKTEAQESPLEAAVREFQEESQCKTEAAQWQWMGQLYFPNFKAHKQEDWWVTVFTTQLSPIQIASIHNQSSEGTLHWIEKNKVLDLNLWDGDRHFIPYVLKKQPFQGTFYYENGSCSRYQIKEI